VSILFISAFSKKINEYIHFKSINPFLPFLIGIIGIAALFFPGVYTIGIAPPVRTVNVIYFFFLIIWLFGIVNMMLYFKAKKLVLKVQAKGIHKIFLFVVIIVLLIFPNNFITVYKEIFNGNVYRYNNQMQMRYTEIENGKDTVNVKALINTPEILFVADMSDDPNHWRNVSQAMYFNKKAIVVK
jgi:hypothetical protein